LNFKDALLHFSKALLCILSMFINTIPGFQRLCPQINEEFYLHRHQAFWGDQLEDELNTFYEEELPNQG